MRARRVAATLTSADAGGDRVDDAKSKLLVDAPLNALHLGIANGTPPRIALTFDVALNTESIAGTDRSFNATATRK